MGYELHITRAPHWTESESYSIGLDEWLTYVRSDPEFRLDNFAEAHVDGGVLRYENEGLAVWLPATNEPGHGGWFDFRRGRVIVKNPTADMIAKMKRIADALNARVVGDEDEEY